MGRHVCATASTPSLRTQRSNPESFRGDSVWIASLRSQWRSEGHRRHPPTRTSTRRHTFASSRLISPELCLISPPSYPRGRREGRVPAGTHGPLRACSAKKLHSGIQVQPKHSAFPAQWVDGLCRALPGAEFLLASLASRIDDAVRPVGLASTSAKSLTVATTARTTRFCRTRIR